MDRLYRNLAGCGLALTLVLPTTGCKTPRPEVPPSPAFSSNGQTPSGIGFNSEANPVSGAGGLPQPGQPGNVGYGTPTPSSTPSYGPAGNGGFGAPGSNLGTPSSMPTTTAPGSAGLGAPGGASNPTTGIPQSGTGPTGPAAGIGAAPTQSPFDH